MGAIKYDLDKLTEGGVIEAVNAVKQYYTYQDYFDGLSAYLDEWPSFMRSYNPTVVIYETNERSNFLSECTNIRAALSQLGIANALTELNLLEDAVHREDIKSLSDGLLTFRAKLEIAAGIVKAACIKPKPLIMAVDDMPEQLTTLSMLLSEYYKVIALSNVADVISALKTHTPALFILDIEMPEINGYELALLIREDERFKSTPIIFLTSQPTLEHVKAAMQYRINDFMVKPVERSFLLEKVEKQLITR